MTGRDDRRRSRLRVLVAVLVAVFAAMFTAALAAGATPSTHSGSGDPPPKSLPINLNLLGIKINVEVPTLNEIIQIGTPSSSSTTSSSPTTPPPTSSPPTSTPPPSPTHTKTSTSAPPPVQFVGAPSRTPTSSQTSSAAKPPAKHHHTKTQTKFEQAITALKNLLPTSLTRGLYLLTLLAAIGVAVGVMRIGRRGSH
jgi:hypothetical protein